MRACLTSVLVSLTLLAGSAQADAHVQSVGTFGGFIRAGVADVPQSNGFLTFSADSNVSAHRLRWQNLMPGGKDFVLGEMRFPGNRETSQLKFIDWSTLAPTATLSGARVTAYLSRTFPAVHYESTTTEFTFATAIDGRAPMSRMTSVVNGKIRTLELDSTAAINMDAMSEPWILLWSGGAAGWPFEVPILLTFEKHPARAMSGSNGVSFSFSGPMGSVNVMPLKGLRRFTAAQAQLWNKEIPADLIIESRAWVSILAAFPVGLTETFTIDEHSGSVAIQDSYRYHSATDAWGTVPTPIAPFPPTVVRAAHKGYPVQYPAAQPVESAISTFYGPFAYAPGQVANYTLPLPHALTRLPIPLRVLNSPATAPIRAELERLLTEDLPRDPATFFIPNDDRAATLMCDAFATLKPDSPLRNRFQALVPRLLANSFSDTSLLASTEPVTRQSYLSPVQHSFGQESFDREWYIGRQLTTIARCAEALDLKIAREVWPKILGLYQYDRIFYDWATGSVLSSVYGINQLADGIHFAWEGMLGVARLARLVGDTATFEDAAYRSARQQLALFATWQQAEWSREIDYGIAHFSAQKIDAQEVETRGAIDAWTEEFGSATLEFRSLWQTTNFIYFDNSAQYSFYRDYGLAKQLKTLEYDIMPRLHPGWTDGNVFEPVDGRFYGSDHTAAHLLARAVLFHDDSATLYALFQSARGTKAEKQWYSMYFYGSAGPLLLGIERAQAPVVELPVALAQLVESTFDAKTARVTLKLLGRCDAKGVVRMRMPNGEWKNYPVVLVRDEKTTFSARVR